MKKKLMLNELEIQSFLTKEGGKTESHAQFAEKIVAGACSYPNYCPFPCSNHPICE